MLKTLRSRTTAGEIRWLGLVVLNEAGEIEVGHVGGPLMASELMAAIDGFVEKTHETMLDAMESNTLVVIDDTEN